MSVWLLQRWHSERENGFEDTSQNDSARVDRLSADCRTTCEGSRLPRRGGAAAPGVWSSHDFAVAA